MIRRGKAEGWLQLPAQALLPWATLNDVTFGRLAPGASIGKGAGLFATEDIITPAGSHEQEALVTVPRALILSIELVNDIAKVDRDLREVLHSLGDFAGVCLLSSSSFSFAIALP